MKKVEAFLANDGIIYKTEKAAINADNAQLIEDLFDENDLCADWDDAAVTFYDFTEWLDILEKEDRKNLAKYIKSYE